MKARQGFSMLRLFEQLNKLNEQRHLFSIRTSFISIMPIMILGAYVTIINQLPIPSYQSFMASIFGERWQMFGSLIFNSTTQIITLMLAFLISSNLAKWYNSNRNKQIHDGICGVVGLASYIVVSLPLEDISALSFNMVGVNGLFVALVVSTAASEILIRLSSTKNKTKLLSDDPNLSVPQSFSSIIPVIIVIGGFALVRIILASVSTSDGFTEIVNRFLSKPYQNSSNSFGTAVLYNISSHFMWLFGIHGNNVLDGVAQTVFVPAMDANVAAVAAGQLPPNLMTKTLFDAFVYMGGSGTTLALLISILIFSKYNSSRILLRHALPNSIFNINEPLIFGIPIVLNPFYAIPFVLTPVLMLFTTALAMKIGLVPYTIQEVSWATPIFISGYMATGSFAGVMLQLVNLALATLIYAPFVLLSEQMSQIRFDRGYQQLLEIVTKDFSNSGQNIINRVDEVGAVARRLANQIDTAMNNGQMFLNYQPIVDTEEHKVHGVEALLRWQHPQHGKINPMVTIALAEETDRIGELGLWILEQAIAQRAQWEEAGLGNFRVSVNISTKQLDDPMFYNRVQALLDQHNVLGNQLQIEITETVALVENTAVSNNLENLSNAGIILAMDDFGVGHSSLLYLRAHPITTLKIDGSLSGDVATNPVNLDIISTIYDLCRLLKVEAVVERVETVSQLDKLLSIGPFLIQGFLYSPPLAANEIPGFIRKMEVEKSMI